MIGAIDFGYITYYTQNIGDDIQSIAAKQFLPKNSFSVNRDFISQFEHPSKIYVIVNGWYMHRQNHFSDYKTGKNRFNWPPAAVIDPILISIYFTQPFTATALSPQGIDYLLKHGPVGARDYSTFSLLQSKKIPSYFSGCLTLTLTNAFQKREEIIYAVDLDEECIAYLKANTSLTVKTLTHELVPALAADPQARLKYAEILLEKYQKAHYVVTSRLHAAMPCLGFQTPVLLINTQSEQSKFNGLKELVRYCSREQFLQGFQSFNLECPKENANTYLPIRENLITLIKDWVASKRRD